MSKELYDKFSKNKGEKQARQQWTGTYKDGVYDEYHMSFYGKECKTTDIDKIGYYINKDGKVVLLYTCDVKRISMYGVLDIATDYSIIAQAKLVTDSVLFFVLYYTDDFKFIIQPINTRAIQLFKQDRSVSALWLLEWNYKIRHLYLPDSLKEKASTNRFTSSEMAQLKEDNREWNRTCRRNDY